LGNTPKRTYQNPSTIIAVQKMGVAEEGTSMSGESKNKARLPDIKVMGFFYF